MPQIVMLLNPKGQRRLSPDLFNELGTILMQAVEEAFGISAGEDAAFDVIAVLYTKNESPFQIEVRYTVGKGVYESGKVFNPSMKRQGKADTAIREAFEKFLKVHDIVTYMPSVWFKPYRNSHFKAGETT